ncbi:MAG: hypothetical protein ACM37W_20035 [Actinomycetota bacterium]
MRALSEKLRAEVGTQENASIQIPRCLTLQKWEKRMKVNDEHRP